MLIDAGWLSGLDEWPASEVIGFDAKACGASRMAKFEHVGALEFGGRMGAPGRPTPSSSHPERQASYPPGNFGYEQAG